MSRVQRVGEVLGWRNRRTLPMKFPFFANKFKVFCLSLFFFERTDELLEHVAGSRHH